MSDFKIIYKEEAFKMMIEFHLKDILEKIHSLAKSGKQSERFFKLSQEQVTLIEKLGYRIDIFNKNFNPVTIDILIYWNE